MVIWTLQENGSVSGPYTTSCDWPKNLLSVGCEHSGAAAARFLPLCGLPPPPPLPGAPASAAAITFLTPEVTPTRAIAAASIQQ